MNTITIRGTDLQVNPIGLGTNSVGGQSMYPTIKDEAGRELLHTALEYGVDFWDTAFIYGPKRSEEIIGEVLHKTKRRHEVVLTTKAAHEFVDGGMVINNTPAFLRQAVEDALSRLQTDYIDLFYIHFPDKDTPKYEAVGVLKELKDEGKIRSIGVSNFSEEQLQEANQDGYVNVYQGEYNLLQRKAEKEIFPYTEKHKISFIPFFPFASGLLAGKYDLHTTFPEGDMRNHNPLFQGETYKEVLQKVEQLKMIAQAKGVEVAHLVLAWYLNQPAIDLVIPGAKKGAQVMDNLHALDVKLTNDEMKEIGDLF